MTNVKIRIEVNPNAETENMGDIQNQVDGIPSSENVSNVSVKINGDNLFQEIPDKRGGINGLSLGGDLVFDENGMLDNPNLQGGVLESTESPVEFIWGIVPSNGEYKVRLVFTDAKSLKDIIIYGDSVVNQFPTQATVNGKTVIYNDDLQWAINLGEESDTHVIEFTHWNKTNYNACISKIAVMLKYIEVDKHNGLKEVESTSQSTSDTTGIYYGSIESFGSIEIVDTSGELIDMIRDGVIDNSNTNLEVMANDKVIQSHISTDSSYDNNSQVLQLDLGNRINSLDILRYEGYLYQDKPENLANLLFDVVSKLKYVLKTEELSQDEFKSMLSEKHDGIMTLYEYLESCVINYPTIEPNKTYRDVIDEFCLIAQMQMFIDDDNNITFVSARPQVFDGEFDAIHIPKSNMFSQLDYSLILKNKYDGVEIDKTVVEDQLNYNQNLYTTNPIDTSRVYLNGMPNSYFSDDSNLTYNMAVDTSGINILGLAQYKTVAVSLSAIRGYYISGSFQVPIKTENNLEQISQVYNQAFGSEGNPYFNLRCMKQEGSCECYVKPSTKGIYSRFYLNGLPTNSASGKEFFGYPSQEASYTYNAGGLFSAGATSSVKSLDATTSYINASRDEKNGVYNVTYNILVGQDILNMGGQYNITTDIEDDTQQIWINGRCERYVPISLEISIYGVKRIINFNQEADNTKNITSAKTKVSLSSSKLLQNSENVNQIKNNILNDYKNGISSGNVTISCNDYYNKSNKKVIDWSQGQVPQVNQIVYFDNDLYADKSQRYWKIKGRTFRKTGVPMIDLELEEVKHKKKLSDCTWDEIKEIAESGAADSDFYLGDSKQFTLNDGRTLTATIIAFNHDTLSNGSGKAGITFAVNDLNETSPMGTSTTSGVSWSDSIVRNEFLPNLYQLFSDDIKQCIKPVKKISINGDYSVTGLEILETIDSLWLFGSDELSKGILSGFNKPIEGGKYSFLFSDYRLLFSSNVLYTKYWLRTYLKSIDNGTTYNFTTFARTTRNSPYADFGSTANSNSEFNIVFGFCI